MRAVAVWSRERAVRVISVPEPHPVDRSAVLLRMLDVGVCGTDREIAGFEYGTPPPGTDRLIIGHESIAEVVAIGGAVRWAKPAQLVVPMVRRPCADASCLAGAVDRPDFCMTDGYRERGIARADGYMTEYVVEDERYLVPVPRKLEDVAVLVEPLSIAAKAAEQHMQMRDR